MMRRFAKIVNEQIEGVYDYDVNDALPTDPSMEEIPLNSELGPGWTRVNGAFVSPFPPTPPFPLKVQIANLERQDLIPRGVREFMLKSLEKEALAAGVSPTVLPAYVKLKARDDQIAALRAQI